MGLSTWDLGSGSDADKGSGSKDHFTFTRPRSGYELSAMLCQTVGEIQSSSAMHAVFVAFGAHMRSHWIWIGDPDPVNPVSVPVWRAPLWGRIHFRNAWGSAEMWISVCKWFPACIDHSHNLLIDVFSADEPSFNQKKYFLYLMFYIRSWYI